MKKTSLLLCVVALSVFGLAACSNVLTYIRHDEGRNVTCDGQQGIKRDSNCNVSPVK